MSNDTFNYNMFVKHNLIKWRDAFETTNHVTLNYTAIANALQTHFNISTSTQKVAAMFNSQSPREIKLQELVAIAQIFDIPLWDLCQYPNNPDSGINTYSLTKQTKDSVCQNRSWQVYPVIQSSGNAMIFAPSVSI